MASIPATLITRLRSATPDRPVVFLIGSGISIPKPSLVPGVWSILGPTLDAASPITLLNHGSQARRVGRRELEEFLRPISQGFARDVQAIGSLGILPEMYYQYLAELSSPDVLRVWEALRFWNTEPSLQTYPLGPNLAHLLVAFLAWKSGAPIITTNFDTMLEEAARRLGLTDYAMMPTEVAEPPGDLNAVAIWKLHGSVQAPESLRTTLRGLTSYNAATVEALRTQLEDRQTCLCLVGYSGRDLDIFPQIANFQLREPAYWVCNEFDESHMLHQVAGSLTNKYVQVQADALGLAEETVRALAPTDPVANSLRSYNSPVFDARAADTEWKALAKAHIGRVIPSCLPEHDPRRLLVHAKALGAVGLLRRADVCATAFLVCAGESATAVEPRFLAHALLFKADVAHDLARFEDAGRYATAAMAIAKRHDLNALTVQARLTSAEARRATLFPLFGRGDAWLLTYPPCWGVLVQMVGLALAFRPGALASTSEEPDLIHAAALSIEHRIRLGSLLQGVFGRSVLRPFGVPFMRHWWRGIAEASVKLGYAHGLGSAHRYADRLTAAPAAPSVRLASFVFEFTSDTEGKLIAARDAAQQYARLAEHATSESIRREYRQKAITEAKRTYYGALTFGDHSLALKALVILRQNDPSFRAAEGLAQWLNSESQGTGYHRAFKKLERWLTGP